MQFVLDEILDREIMHYAEYGLHISSRYNTIYIERQAEVTRIPLPDDGWKSILGGIRLARRALRLDKCNVMPVGNDLVIIRQGQVYHYSSDGKKLSKTMTLRNCRNLLHQSIAVLEDGQIFFGEYGNNSGRKEVPIYRSRDGGRTWETVFLFPQGRIKHIHGCYWDPFEEKIWVFTGDFAGECYLLCADKNFQKVEWIGDGQQAYRTCNAFFEPDAIHWIMDSQLEDSYHVRMDRRERTIAIKQAFPGPVWYIKRLQDGFYLAATAQEIGPGVHDRDAHLLVSQDLEHWDDLTRFPHDGLPKRYFKFGVVGFADGLQTSTAFYLFFEALRGLDGKTAHCHIKV